MRTGLTAKTWGLFQMPEQLDLPRAHKHQAPGLMSCALETRDGLSHNWFVAASQVGFSTEQRKAETTSSTRIAAGLISGLACFAAVLTGGIFVGQTIGEALGTLHTIAPVEVDPHR